VHSFLLRVSEKSIERGKGKRGIQVKGIGVKDALKLNEQSNFTSSTVE